jgi:probable HAF family extracellular repeat protein
MAMRVRPRIFLLAAVFTTAFPARAITTSGLEKIRDKRISPALFDWIVFWVFLVLVASVNADQVQAGTVQYSLTVLGLVQHNYPDSYFNPAAVNDSDVIAGNATVRVPHNTGQSERGILWVPSTRYTVLGTISEGPGFDSQATCINSLGIAAGQSYEHLPGGGFGMRPVMFTSNGVVDLGVKNGVAGWATGINDDSQVVGYVIFSTPVPASQAFLYQNGVMTLLGYPVPTIGYSAAYAINNNGLIVGTAQFAAGADYHAASYLNGTWTDLGSIGSGGSYHCYASSVNDSGVIVGAWGNALLYGGFIYQNGQITDLASPTVSDSLVAPTINNAGQIVYGKYIYQAGAWQDINTLIEPGSDWQLTGATGINNNGDIIGYIYNPTLGIYRAGLLTVVQ